MVMEERKAPATRAITMQSLSVHRARQAEERNPWNHSPQLCLYLTQVRQWM